MVKAVLTPSHSHALETLLDEPCAGTFHHPAPHRQAQRLVLRIVDMIPVLPQVRMQCDQSMPRGVRPPLDLQPLDEVCQDPVRLAMAQPVPRPAKPPPRLGRADVQPGRRPLPQVLHGVVTVQDAHGRGRQPLIIEAPQAPGAITESHDLWGRVNALAYGFKLPVPPCDRLL